MQALVSESDDEKTASLENRPNSSASAEGSAKKDLAQAATPQSKRMKVEPPSIWFSRDDNIATATKTFQASLSKAKITFDELKGQFAEAFEKITEATKDDVKLEATLADSRYMAVKIVTAAKRKQTLCHWKTRTRSRRGAAPFTPSFV